jgi:hypothetical protein
VFVLGDRVEAELFEVLARDVDARLDAGARDDVPDWNLVAPVVGYADDGGFGDRLVFVEQGFDLGGVDVVPRSDDQVVPPDRRSRSSSRRPAGRCRRSGSTRSQ